MKRFWKQVAVDAERVVRLLPPLVFDAAQARQLVDTLAPLIRALLAGPMTQPAARFA